MTEEQPSASMSQAESEDQKLYIMYPKYVAVMKDFGIDGAKRLFPVRMQMIFHS